MQFEKQTSIFSVLSHQSLASQQGGNNDNNSAPPPRRTVAFDSSDASSDTVVGSTTTGRERRHSSKDAGDCRTRSYVQSAMRKASIGNSQSMTSDSSHVSGVPARIFEHVRGMSNEDSLGRHTSARAPGSWAEIESWLSALVEDAIHTPADAAIPDTSSIRILFLNEKRCKKIWSNEGFDFADLHTYLKVNDWTTSHYQTTYCRYPVPLDVEDASEWRHRYSVSHPYDWDVLWAYFPRTRTTVGLMRTWFDNYDADFQELESTIETFPGPTLAHPMLFGLFCLQILTSDTLANVREKGNRLFEAQKLTGFHTYTHLRTTSDEEDSDSDDTGDLSAVTREILGAASNMTGWDNASLQMVGFARFIMAENERQLARATVPAAPASLETGQQEEKSEVQRRMSEESRKVARLCQYVEEMSLKLISDLDGAKHDAAAWLATATFLLQGVLNLVSQKDAHVNISLAKSSNRIALDTKRDSTSMMAIAIVTMFFLPGTFTAGFFALPFFQTTLQDIGQFWIYWVVTVPLTLAVLVVFRLWMWYIKRADAGPKSKRAIRMSKV